MTSFDQGQQQHVHLMYSAPAAGFVHVHSAAGLGSTFLIITSSTLQSNKATSGQAASSFNELQGSGGAVWMNCPFCWISNTTFRHNSAGTVGGAVFFITSKLTVSLALLLTTSKMHSPKTQSPCLQEQPQACLCITTNATGQFANGRSCNQSRFSFLGQVQYCSGRMQAPNDVEPALCWKQYWEDHHDLDSFIADVLLWSMT